MPQRDARLIGGIYRLGQSITTGAMLNNYTAYNHNTNDVVGLTVIDTPEAEQIEQMAPLLSSFEKRQLVQSPHVIKVHNWGLDGSRIYIATDPPRGLTLQHVLDNENIAILRAIDLCRQIATGLKALHDQGIAGIDLRPQLITVDTIGITDRVQIDDIGIRSLLHSLNYMSSQRQDDIGFFDPRYSPPEQINEGPIGPWSDIYQLGILLFTLVTGRLPFVGRTPAETGIFQNTHPIPLMSQYKHNTPKELQELLHHLLAKDPRQRFANAGALITALETMQYLPVVTSSGPVIAIKHPEPNQNDSGNHSATMEMREIKEDISLLSTLIEGKTPIGTPTNQVPSPSGTFAYLYYEKKGEGPQRIPIRHKSVIIGRNDPKRGVSPDIDLSQLDTTMSISRQHARIKFEGTFFSIEDLKSRNKTRLGTLVLTPLKPEIVQHGDIITFGSVRMRFEIAH